MKERPILFQSAMVRALPDGSKTQTRRVARAALLDDGTEYRDDDGWPLRFDEGTACDLRAVSPYGAPGDELWVREAWRALRCWDAYAPRDIPQGNVIWYEADGAISEASHDGGPTSWGKLRPGMFMPRWASRIQLEITDVRVERLQAITEADARAEGSRCIDEATGREVLFPNASRAGSWRLGYRVLWDEINGPGAWDANPRVWVVSFRRIKP